jgi:hypothetical protein
MSRCSTGRGSRWSGSAPRRLTARLGTGLSGGAGSSSTPGCHVINNQRFCVLPTGRQPNLASAVLARVLRRVGADYLAVYGHRVIAVETCTDPCRHTGACYTAANVRLVGDTLGFSRSAGSYHQHGQAGVALPAAQGRARNLVLDVPASAVEPEGTGGRLEHAGAGRRRRAAGRAALTDPRAKRGIRHQAAAILMMTAVAALPAAASGRSPTSSQTCPRTRWPGWGRADIRPPGGASRPARPRSAGPCRQSTRTRPTH